MKESRREKIGAILDAKSFISLSELQKMFPEVSGMTLRRDIEFFEEQGKAIKVRGGARSTKYITTAHDDSISQRMSQNVTQKKAIVQTAAEYLETGRSIFLDSGSTVQQIVPYITNERFTFTTTNPQLAIELSKIGLPIVNIIGGRLDSEYQSVSGLQALKYISDINIDIALISTSGYSDKSGFTGASYSESELKHAIIQKANFTVMLMDYSKVSKSLPYTFCDISDIDVLITDAELDADTMAKINADHVKLTNVRNNE